MKKRNQKIADKSVCLLKKVRKINKEKEKAAIDFLKAFEPEDEPYWLAYSGGKDSDCVRILAELSGVKYELAHELTTVDAPETMRYIHSIPNVKIYRRELNMQQLILSQYTPPTRKIRYCCSYFKESHGRGRLRITGVRKSESVNRIKLNDGVGVTIYGKPKHTQKEASALGVDYHVGKNNTMILDNDNDASRRLVESCYRSTSVVINPILEWSEQNVWEFLHYYGCESNPLYKEGYDRIGCVGCPLQGAIYKQQDFVRWPNYRKMYVKTFDKMIERRRETGKPVNDRWRDGEAVMRWWLEEEEPEDNGPISMFAKEGEEDK